MKYFSFIFLLLLFNTAIGSDSLRYRAISVSFFSNATAMPGSTFLKPSALHPGVCVGTEFKLKTGLSNFWLQTAKLGYFYHQYAQHAIQFYTENAYRHQWKCGFQASAAAGVGLLVSKADLQVFKLYDDGTYKTASAFRLQVMPSISVELGWQFLTKKSLPWRVFVSYQMWFQLPYVKQYVPILPNVAPHVGFSLPINY